MAGEVLLDALRSRIGRELKDNPPRAVRSALRKKGKKHAEKVRRAIFLSKLRRSGVYVPERPR